MENIKERYVSYDPRVLYYMKQVINYFEKSYGAISGEQILSLDMLANNFKMYFHAMDDIEKNGMMSKDAQNRSVRNPSISLFMNCLNYIAKQLSSCGLTIASQARLTRGGMETSEENFIDNLVH